MQWAELIMTNHGLKWISINFYYIYNETWHSDAIFITLT